MFREVFLRYFVQVVVVVALLANCAVFIVLYPAYLSKKDGVRGVFEGASAVAARDVLSISLVSEVSPEYFQLSPDDLTEADLVEEVSEVEIGIDSSAVFDQSAPGGDSSGE